MFGPDFSINWWFICHSRSHADAILKRFMDCFSVATQVELAHSLKVRQSEISDWKRRNGFPLAIFEKAIGLNGLNPEWLITGDGEQLLTDMPDQHTDHIQFSIFVRGQIKYLLNNYEFTCLPHGYVTSFAANLFNLQDHPAEVLIAEVLRRLCMATSIMGLPMNELRKVPLDIEYSRTDIIRRAGEASGMDRPTYAKTVARYVRQESVEMEEAEMILRSVEEGEMEFPLELLFYLLAAFGVNIIYVLTGLGKPRTPLLVGNADDAWH